MSTRQQGSILLSLAVIVFLVGVAAAGWVSWQLWQERPNKQPDSAADMPSAQETNDVLLPAFTVDSQLAEDTPTLTSTLLQPMRQYYATKSERVASIVVKAVDEDHTAQVTAELVSSEGSRTIEFFYDREGEDRDGDYPVWTASMLDNTE